MPRAKRFASRRPGDRGPSAANVELRAKRLARQRDIGIAKARLAVRRSITMRSYWTRVKSYQSKHPRLTAREAARSKGFKRTEGQIKRGEKGVREGATEHERQAAAEKLMRALQRQGLVIGKGKTWRDYVRKRRR